MQIANKMSRHPAMTAFTVIAALYLFRKIAGRKGAVRVDTAAKILKKSQLNNNNNNNININNNNNR